MFAKTMLVDDGASDAVSLADTSDPHAAVRAAIDGLKGRDPLGRMVLISPGDLPDSLLEGESLVCGDCIDGDKYIVKLAIQESAYYPFVPGSSGNLVRVMLGQFTRLDDSCCVSRGQILAIIDRYMVDGKLPASYSWDSTDGLLPPSRLWDDR